MIDEIRKAILRKINTFRDKDTKIYSESIEQGFQEPCFYIKEVNSSQNRELGNRYKREHLYDIHYFPNLNSSTKNTDMRAMAEVLYEQLEYIEVAGRPLRGYDMNYRIVDGVLHFFVRYPIFVRKEIDPIPKMENLEIEGGLKDDK